MFAFCLFLCLIGGKFAKFFILNVFWNSLYDILHISKFSRCCTIGKTQPWLLPFFVGSNKLSMGFYVFLKLSHLNFAFVSKVGVFDFFVPGMWRTLCF